MTGRAVRSVWAPGASSVELVPDHGAPRPMQRADGPTGEAADRPGWWVDLDTASSASGGYRFRVDGGEPRPDPRSWWQPDGVHASSHTLDLDRFAWGDDGFRPAPLTDAVIYELHVGTFTPDGTFAGVGGRLDHLVDLGVTHIELMPIAAFSGQHGWGYDGVALFAPHVAYGPPQDLQALVDDCHRHGIAVLLDVVYNHLGPEGNYLATYGPYFTDRYATPWGPAVNVDGPESDEVRRFIIDNACHWLDHYHIDGLRLDAVHAIIDTSAVHLLEQLRHDVDDLARRTGRSFVLIAEHEGNHPRIVQPAERGGYGLDAHWNDDVHHALHTALTGEHDGYYVDYDGITDVADALEHGYVFRGQYSPHRQRHVGRDPAGVSGDQLVAFLQNHDHIGNRSGGERIAEISSIARQKVGAAIVLTSPFVPLLFQGEEWAASSPFPFFADHEDPVLVDAVRRNRLAEFVSFGWSPDEVVDPEDPATVANATLRWNERTAAPHADVLEWYRQLIHLRHTHRALHDRSFGSTTTRTDTGRGLLVVRRGSLVVVADLGPDPIDLTADRDDWFRGTTTLMLASDPDVTVGDGLVHLVPDSVAVIETNN